MGGTRRPQFPALISLDRVEAFRGYVITWFADAATTYLINMRLGKAVKEKANLLCQEADKYVAALKERNPDACRDNPVPLTPNDDEEYFDLCKAVEMICDYSRGKIETYALQPALSFEFTEYVRSFMPQVRDKTLKREVVGVESILHGLAVIGARITRAYRGEEWGYVFMDVPNPEVIDYRKLSSMVAGVSRSVSLNEGSKLSFLVGAASAVALIYGKMLSNITGKSHLKLDSVRLARAGNKVMVKAFEMLDLSSLASRILRLGVSLPVYSLLSRYPSKEKHVLRAFIERLSKAIIMCELVNDYTEIYSTMRIVTSENFLKEIRSYENWVEIVSNLLRVRVL